VRKSLGLLEIKGLASAILVADAMAKTAAVTIVGIETCKGGGWQTIKVVGDVAAVQASLSSGSELAKRSNSFVAMKTLSRPDQSIMDTWGVKPAEKAASIKAPIKAETFIKEPVVEAPVEEAVVSDTPEEAPVTDYDIVEEEVIADSQPSEEKQPESVEEDEPEAAEATCNLCGDPLCPRAKGEPHTKCIHNTKVK
jgi:microcompartment protein CcmL/EutN